MSLTDELAGDQTRSGGRGCVVCRWLDSRGEAEAAEFKAALSDATWQTATLHRAMKRRGATFEPSTLLRHRRDHK